MAATDPEPGPYARELKRRRTGADLSQKAAARRCGVGDSRWRQIEAGYQMVAGIKRPTEPTTDFIIPVARGLRWDIREALTLAGYNPDDVVIPDPEDISPPEALIEDWAKLNVQQRELVRNLVTLFVDPAAVIKPTIAVPVDARNPGFSDLSDPRSAPKKPVS